MGSKCRWGSDHILHLCTKCMSSSPVSNGDTVVSGIWCILQAQIAHSPTSTYHSMMHFWNKIHSLGSCKEHIAHPRHLLYLYRKCNMRNFWRILHSQSHRMTGINHRALLPDIVCTIDTLHNLNSNLCSCKISMGHIASHSCRNPTDMSGMWWHPNMCHIRWPRWCRLSSS